MLVYGDAERREACREMIGRIRDFLGAASASSGIVRHGLLVAALIEAGELAQGVADHAFAARERVDARSPEADAAMELTLALARQVARSWSNGFADPEVAEVEAALRALAALDALPLPFRVTVRQPEGFAHYALYPEAYVEAAQALAPGEATRIIGIRSIGTTLAAMVAAATGSALAPVTLRPVGHPFSREVSVAPGLAAELGPSFGTRHSLSYAIVDEGPGLSGSSFASVARFLEGQGASLGRIHLLPSHLRAPGPEALPETLRIWQAAPRHVCTFDDLVLGAAEPAHRLETWIADLVGAPQEELLDISGGRWRRAKFEREADWPPVLAWQERRKFLARTETGTWLLKFAGLGRVGLRRYERARALAEAGFTPEPIGWRHGFLVERWHGAAAALDPIRADRGALIGRLGQYLGFRARAFPAEPGRGASIEDLFAMARQNSAKAVGEGLAGRLDRWRPMLDSLEARCRPIETDNRLHVWEWLDESGRMLKTDALDHHAGHDLVGAQDVAWDIVGAEAEFGLTGTGTQQLAGLVERESGTKVDPDLLTFLRPCYLAFQLGFYALAAAGTDDPAERGRLEAAARRYRGLLVNALYSL